VLSVIIPTRLAHGIPPRTLETLSMQDIDPAGVELLVVTDGAWPDRVAALRAMPRPFAGRVIEQPHGGLASARNRGASEAAGAFLVFIDDDVELASDFLRRIEQALVEGADVVAADIRIGDWVPETMPVREARRARQEYDDSRQGDAPVRFDDVAFAATGIRRTWFERVGGFDVSFTDAGSYGNEDVDLAFRLLRGGAVVRRAPGAVAFTDETHELSSVLARARKVGRNDVRLVRKHPELAAEVFGRKLVGSRIHRRVGTAVMRVPALCRLDAPLRWVVARVVVGGRDGSVGFRLWYALRALHYWRGVAEAGGGSIARAARSAAARSTDERRSRRAIQASGARSAGHPDRP
jgi:GT2 family glycosyltransferase